jgi:hypothetical protein
MWDEAFSENTDLPLDLADCSLEAHDNGAIPRIIHALHHLSLRKKPLPLIIDRLRPLPQWMQASAAIKRNHPVLNLMLLKSPARWLRGEQRLVQRIRATPLPEWSDDDENESEHGKVGGPTPHFDLGRRYALRGIAGHGAFAKVGWGVAAGSGDELAYKRVPDVLPDQVAARRIMREVSASSYAHPGANLTCIPVI